MFLDNKKPFLNYCNLKFVNIHNNIVSISEEAFCECENFKKARLSKGLQIDKNVFSKTTKIVRY